MRRRRFLLHALSTAVGVGSFPVHAKSARRLPSLAGVLRRAGPSIVDVTVEGVSRTGVLLASRGLVMTVADRVPVSADVRIGGEALPSKVVAHDGALLMLLVGAGGRRPFPSAVVASKAPAEKAWAAGLFSSTEGVQGSLGGVLKKREDAWTLDLPVPKSSAVFDRHGSFLSMVTEQHNRRRCTAVPHGRVLTFFADVRRRLG